ncbi:hypothetical protein MVEG_06575 [Podila verticillata NRRL 6337]|nr:hypothetical protein MVEG_06575 [Podila verticillata NRRL 6337]
MVFWPGSITAIISPLIALMNDQHQKLVNAKIPHIVLSGDNSDAIDSDTIGRICEGEFRAVFMSPEIIFGDSPTSKLVQGLWSDKRWRDLLLAIVVDEVHCVEKWGKQFRPEYARLGELRIWSPGVPFVGVTATLTADALTQTMKKLFLSKANVLRVQEIPTNVRLEVHTQPVNAKHGLNRLLGKDKTIVYFEKISLLMDVFGYLSTTRPDLQGKLGVYFSTCTSRKKEETMIKFVEGDIHVLLATEAAGMGCDIPDVIQVIQYGFPRDMPSLVQRFGRAARDPKIQGLGILYAPPRTKTSPTDKNVREYLINQRRRYPSRSAEEKHMALETLLAWRKEAYERWVNRRPYRTGRETWILPDVVAKQLSQRFSGAKTYEAVKAIASSCRWTPLGGDIVFGEIAQILNKLNNEIDTNRKSGSQTMATSALDQLGDGANSDGKGSDGEESLPEP